ncbi:hypothetical protein NE236_26305 [Actinoallomurus purpureus]|uniref:hypothetical protein n=1 Tax=Actinoallomurus purpureus TaxID=478114 RepID=UPI002093A0C7|nr:hypothetical protein [Actinoallomurus purpureus]MCO6008494.1 hypothetical protein [Actinoallomurus purpureus]
MDEIAEIRAAACARTKAGLLIAGPAGVGKSRLLREACADRDVVPVQATRAGAELAVLEYLSLGEPVGLATLIALTSAEACEAVEEAQLASVLRDGRRTQIRLAHPIYGEVIRASCPVLRARRRQAELAAVTKTYGHRRREDVMRIAAWRLESGTATEPGPLLTAAALAYAVSDLSLALRLAEAAVAAGGGLDATLTLAQFRIWSAQPRRPPPHSPSPTWRTPTSSSAPATP